MTDARNFAVQETLKNGLRVTVRAIRPDDREAFLAAFRGLDEVTFQLRFFGPKRELSPRELTEATEVDFVRTVALVTCLQDETGEKIIGAGRYIAFGDAEPPDRAELAFTVEEDYHGLGIASIILRHLAAIAKKKGIAEFHAEVLPGTGGCSRCLNGADSRCRRNSARVSCMLPLPWPVTKHDRVCGGHAADECGETAVSSGLTTGQKNLSAATQKNRKSSPFLVMTLILNRQLGFPSYTK
jgi:GNAT superfamily N-acetyltransferase